MSDFKRIRENVQKMVDQAAPDYDIDGYLESEGFTPNEFRLANQNFGTFMSAVKRGGKNVSSLVADWIPIMGATALEKVAPDAWKPTIQGYKDRQMKEAVATQEEIAKKLPAEYESYKELEGIGDAFGYAKEALGESLASFLPGVVTGGVGSIAGRGAVAKAGQVAGETARKAALEGTKKAAATGVPGAAEELISGYAGQRASAAGLEAAKKAMFRTELGRDVAATFVGSAALNIPEAYQSIYSETGQESLLPAIAAGSFNGLLDSIVPLNVLRSAKGKGLTGEAIMGAWYKRAAAGLGKGALTEGATEALQEITNTAAVKFIDENKDIFTPENLVKFIDSGIRGAIAGGGVQMATDTLLGKRAPEPKAPPPVTPLVPPLGTPAPLPEGISGPLPVTPIKVEGVPTEEGPMLQPVRDLAGVVPEQQLEAPTTQMRPVMDEQGRVVGYEPVPAPMPAPELVGEQAELAFPGQAELLTGPEPTQPTPTPEAPPTNIYGGPAAPVEAPSLPDALRGVVDEAKKDPTASKLLKGNNTASAKYVSDRIQALLPDSNDDPVQAMENLYEADRTGRYPAGTKALTDPQRELLETTYKRLTGMDIDEGVASRAMRGAEQADLFAPQQAELFPRGPEPQAPSTMAPEEAWGRHKNDDHPAFADLNDAERNAWAQLVSQNRGNAANFQELVQIHNDRIEQESVRTPEQIREATKKHEAEMDADIESDLKGKDFFEVLKYLMSNGPMANREIAKKIHARAKEMQRAGYKFKFAVADTPARAIAIGGYSSSGVAGRVRPDFIGKVMDVSVAGKNSGQVFGGSYEVVTHEFLHAVTAAVVEYGEVNANTQAHKLNKELRALYKHIIKHLKDKEAADPNSLTQFEKQALLGYNNALGNMTVSGRRYNELHELMSWGMSRGGMMEMLENIPYKKTNVFSAFVDLVRRYMGLAPKANTALAELMSVTERVMTSPVGEISAMQQAMQPLEAQTAAPASNLVGTAPPQQTTKLQPAPTGLQPIKNAAQNAQNAFAGDWWTKWRVGWVDVGAGLSKRLKDLPVFDKDGKLRADMLVRAASQTINLVKTGLQSGIPVISADGTIIIQRDANNIARSQQLADALDDNAIVKASGLSGRGFVATIARALRGKEIQEIDARRRETAALQLGTAAAQLRRAYEEFKKGRISKTTLEKIRGQVRETQKRYKPDLKLNREKQIGPADIAWAEANLQAVPEVQEVLNIWRNINDSLINLWEQTGLLDKDYADNLRAQRFYVPLYAAREDLMAEEQEGYTGKAAGAKTVAEIEKLSGSDKTRNLWENMDKHYAFMTAKAYNNHTRKMAVQQLMSFGIDGAKFTKSDDPKVNLRYRDYNSPEADKNGIVSVIVENPLDVAAFQIIPYEMGALMKGISMSTEVLRAGALINPMYWIRQLIRDPLHASIAGQLDTIVTPFHAMKEYIQILTDNSEEAKLLAERGLIGQIDPTISLQDYLKQVGTEKVKPSQISQWSKKIMRMHEASDAATRVAIFKNEKAFALKQGMNEEQATNYAVHKARESINFAVRGNSKTLNTVRHMIPFFSAALTSLDTLYRTISGYGLNEQEKAQARQIFVKRAAMMALLSTVYAMMMQDDEDYKKLPDNVKDDNWLLPSPIGSEHTFIKIPIPFEIGFMFKTLPEGVVRYMADTSTGKEVLASYRRGFMRSMPGEGVLIPQAFKPGLEAVFNYSLFTGRSIEGMSDQGLPVEMRGPNASEFSKVMSSLGLSEIGLSPAKIDHLIRGYTAELGTFTTGVASTMMTELAGKEPPAKNIENQLFFRSFLTDPNTSKAATDFYDIMQNAQQAVNALNRLKKEGRVEEAEVLLSDEEQKKLISVAPSLRRVQDQMAKIRSRMNQIKSDYDRDPEERREEINKLQTMYDTVARQGYKVLESAGIER